MPKYITLLGHRWPQCWLHTKLDILNWWSVGISLVVYTASFKMNDKWREWLCSSRMNLLIFIFNVCYWNLMTTTTCHTTPQCKNIELCTDFLMITIIHTQEWHFYELHLNVNARIIYNRLSPGFAVTIARENGAYYRHKETNRITRAWHLRVLVTICW